MIFRVARGKPDRIVFGRNAPHFLSFLGSISLKKSALSEQGPGVGVAGAPACEKARAGPQGADDQRDSTKLNLIRG
jgi:hypothetical protein